MIDSFLDGATGAGLFGRLRWPGAPTEFIDSRSMAEFNPKTTAAATEIIWMGQISAPEGQEVRDLPRQIRSRASSEIAVLRALGILITTGMVTAEAIRNLLSTAPIAGKDQRS